MILETHALMRVLAYTLMAIGVLNFASFMIVSTALGGDAPHGKIEGDKYYLGGHGHYTEVSHSTFEYSAIHSEWFLVTLPLVFVGGLILDHQRRKKNQA
jgi:hypothetical protein